MSDDELAREVVKVREFIGNQPYSIQGQNAIGREVTVVVPFGTMCGISLWLTAMRLFARAAWTEFVGRRR